MTVPRAVASIAIDIERPGREHWQELLPQSDAT